MLDWSFSPHEAAFRCVVLPGGGVPQRRHAPRWRSRLEASRDEYTRLAADLARAVARVCPRWLSDGRDDLVQVALLRVMDVRRRSGAELNAGYLRRVAWSALVDEIRARRRRREVALPEEADLAPPASREASPEEQAATREIGRGIGDCLSRLSEGRRLAVTLHLQGHTVPESAGVLGWSVKRTENLVYRGLAELRDCLSAKGLKP